MSVLHLLGSAADGGAEAYFGQLVAALQRAGGDQAAIVRAHSAREAALRAAGVPVDGALFGSPLDVLTKGRVARVAGRRRARVLTAWMNRAAFHAPRGRWARVGRLGGYYDLKYYRGFDALVANTADIGRWIEGQGWPAARVRVIPNFAAEATAGPAADRARWATPEEAPLLLALGRLHPNKAQDVALKALARLPGVWLWLAGEGLRRTELEELATRLGVAERVRFLGWVDDPGPLYRAADAVVFPSRREPLGNVVLQAWAHGAPVVAAASVGPAALIRDGEDGLLVPVEDDAALAAAAGRLLDDAGLRGRLATAGLARVRAEFGEAAVVGQWRGLFGELGGCGSSERVNGTQEGSPPCAG